MSDDIDEDLLTDHIELITDLSDDDRVNGIALILTLVGVLFIDHHWSDEAVGANSRAVMRALRDLGVTKEEFSAAVDQSTILMDKLVDRISS